MMVFLTSTRPKPLLIILAIICSNLTSAASLGAYNVDPDSVSISGFSSGGFMATQLGIAYSSVFKVGFGVFAGGPFDCARNQPNKTCMNNNTPSIKTPTENIRIWSGKQVDDIANLRARKVYMQVGELDRTTGPNVLSQLSSQLSGFVTEEYTTYFVSPGAGHTFPTAFDSVGNTDCGASKSPFISNCGYDGAGEVLGWLYGRDSLKPKNKGRLKGIVLDFDQIEKFGAGANDSGMGEKGYLYVPDDCRNGSSSTPCKLHVALHGCCQSYDLIGNKFVENTGYNQWADTNNIIVLYPQTTVDNSPHTIWDGGVYANPLACWDWIGLYGEADLKGGVQMEAIVNQVKRIISGFGGNNGCADADAGAAAEAISARGPVYPDREL